MSVFLVYSMLLDTPLDSAAEGSDFVEAVWLTGLLVFGGLVVVLLFRWLLSRMDETVDLALERRRQGQGGAAAPDSRRARVRRTSGVWRGRPLGGGHIPEG